MIFNFVRQQHFEAWKLYAKNAKLCNTSLSYDDETWQQQMFGLQPNLIQLGKNFTTLDNAASRQKSTPDDDDKDTWTGTRTSKLPTPCLC